MRYAVFTLARAGLVVAVVTLTVSAQAPPSFEAASIKESPPPGRGPFRVGAGPRPGSGRYESNNLPLLSIIRAAYPDYRFEAQIVGGPAWVRTTRYDINAVAAGAPPADQMRLMVRHLLAERFGLKVRTEPREIEVYALVLARSDGRLGPKLTKATIDCEARAAAIKRGDVPAPPPLGSGSLPARLECGMLMTRSGTLQRIVISGQPIAGVITPISLVAGRPVVDRTGLTDKYEIELEFAPTTGPMPVGAADASPAASIFTAVQEQLGLKLEPRKESMDVLVIEDVHPPTPD